MESTRAPESFMVHSRTTHAAAERRPDRGAQLFPAPRKQLLRDHRNHRLPRRLPTESVVLSHPWIRRSLPWSCAIICEYLTVTGSDAGSDAGAARAGGQAQRVVWCETGRACTRQYRDVDGWHALRPDAAGEYQAGTQRLRFWLEWDRGTMGRRDLETKFAAYAHYVRSGEWRADGNTLLPHLLVVTTDRSQEFRLLAALATAFAGGPCALAVRMALRDQLMACGPRSAIWRPWLHEQATLGAPAVVFA